MGLLSTGGHAGLLRAISSPNVIITLKPGVEDGRRRMWVVDGSDSRVTVNTTFAPPSFDVRFFTKVG